MSSRKPSKKCFVPGCSSNNCDEPLKPFIKLPPGTDIRKRWAQEVGREGKNVYFNPISSIYCCGDHFNLEKDAENWMKYRIMGGSIRLKPGVLPRIPKLENKDPLSLERTCKSEQPEREYARLQPRSTQSSDKHSIDIKHEPLINGIKTERKEYIFEQIYIAEQSNLEYQNIEPQKKTLCHKDIQCNINIKKHVRSKSTQTDQNLWKCSRATSPIRFRKQRKK